MVNEKAYGSLIKPFGQYTEPLPPSKVLKEWHSIRDNFINEIHNGKNDGAPKYPEILQLIPDELVSELEESGRIISIGERKKQYCYLWVINKDDIIEILWENTQNEMHIPDKLVKHSNITAADLAYNGGEMYFASNNRLFINNASDRYGLRRNFWNGAFEVIKKIYSKYKVIDIQKWE